jgi:hypothetical protein
MFWAGTGISKSKANRSILMRFGTSGLGLKYSVHCCGLRSSHFFWRVRGGF